MSLNCKKRAFKSHAKLGGCAESVRRDYILSYKDSHQCVFCGESRAVCLDFHHRRPSEKLFSISACSGYSLAKVKVEIRKCIIVCANCHRVLHALVKPDVIERGSEGNPVFDFPLFDALREVSDV